MGQVDPATLRPELREALKGISPGQTTGVVKVPTGFAILKVLTASDSGADKNANPARIQPLVATGTDPLCAECGREERSRSGVSQFAEAGRLELRICPPCVRFAENQFPS